MKHFLIGILLFTSSIAFAQVKISGVILDTENNSIPYANVIFSGSTTGTISDENGKFYLESEKNYSEIEISFIGYESRVLKIERRNFNLKIVLTEQSNQLEEVVLYSGRIKNKGNPAIPILKKIWEKRRQNGTHLFDQYQYNKYEKLEFDLNNIDSVMINHKLFKGMEFIFENIDTSKITGKSYLPIFINEAIYETYGNNITNKNREDLKANKNSGFESNQHVIAYVKDLYFDYNIYDNYIKIYDKSFVSPLSKSGLLTYNYVLTDSAYIKGKWCYNIIYYPRRKSELTFKGDFWVNDSTFAVKEINLQANKKANVNWIKDIYIEQEYDVLNDSVFLLKRDFMMSDFGFGKKEKNRGLYGKRTTIYNDYLFDIDKGNKFYNSEANIYEESLYKKDNEYWSKNRQEKLGKDELGIYAMLDTLQTVPKFKTISSLVTILGSGYIEFNNFDYGPIFSTIGTNDVEGLRLRAGGRTYFGSNDLWRLQGYTAYGFKDDQVKYGLSGKWMIENKNRITLSAGNRRDVEQIGVSLTTTNDVLGRSFASSSFFSTGDSGKLTSINLSNFFVTIEPVKNITFRTGVSYRTLKSASETFNLDYYDENGNVQSQVKQTEYDFTVQFTPKRKPIGYGVERNTVSNDYAAILINYTRGTKKIFDSDFAYHKLQLFYHDRFLIGGIGRTFTTFEAGKIFGKVPLGLLSIVPGNQSYFLIDNTYSLLDYYDFVTDTHASAHIEHHFNGRFLSKLPLLKKLNLREIAGFKAVWGEISDENIAINASDLIYQSPEDIYIEYSAGIGNILKVFRLDFIWRGSYRNLPNSNNFGIKGSFGFYF